jgi:CRP/FNR family transcriptional regulator
MQLSALAERCRARTLKPRETLFEEGAACSGLSIIATGCIEVRQTSLRGRQQVFHTEGPGATLGEGPLLDQGGYIASAVALESSRVLFLPRADVLALCRQRHPSASGLVVDLQFTHAQLGARLGTVRELVARAFAQLERAGIISRTAGRIVIRDRARLEDFALGDTHDENRHSSDVSHRPRGSLSAY